MTPLRPLWRLLTQASAEADPGFRHEIGRRSQRGLRTIGWALIGATAGLMVSMRAFFPGLATPAGSTALMSAVAAIGAATLLWSRTRSARRHARAGAFLVSVAVSWCSTASLLLRAESEPMFLYLINAEAAVILLIVLMAVPFRPLDVLLIGGLAELFFFASYRTMASRGLLAETGGADLNLMFLSVLTVLAAGVSAGRYQQMWESYEAHRRELESAERLREAQCRMVVSDMAASTGRLAAALSHELNNPLGVLKSSLDTMKALVIEGRTAPPAKQAALQETKVRLCHNAQEAVERLRNIVARMQRFTNLDRAEVLPVAVNKVLADVAEIVKDAADKPVRFETDFRPLPEIEARPQVMSAAFSALLQSAVEASPESEPIRLKTRFEGKRIRIEIEDRGPGMTPEEAEAAMEPDFQVRDGRVAACNWSLFAARQIVRQHGGEISIRTAPGEGKTLLVTLPVHRLLAGADADRPPAEAGGKTA